MESKYLEDIVNGMMLYQGVYQTKDYIQDKSQKFKGTVFYFDTKLILRALGYSWDAQVQATQELIELITKDYGGKIGVFSETIGEVQNALSAAAYSIKKGCRVDNNELNIFVQLNPEKAKLLNDFSKMVKEQLESDSRFIVETRTSVSKVSVKHFIDTENLEEYLKKKNEWRLGAIHNDVSVINQINILRKGDYSERYGGKDKLPVFVTSNALLVKSIREYIAEQKEQDENATWNIHALPVITDNMVLFRLWVPYARKYTNLPAITLARYAYAAQNTNSSYFERLKKEATEYSRIKGIDLINLSEARREKLEDLVITKTEGNEDNISEKIVASSVDELVKLENINLHEAVDTMKITVEEQDKELQKKDSKIIELIANPFINRVGLWPRVLLFLAKTWWIWLACIFYIVTDLINQALPGGNLRFTVALPIILQMLFFITDKVLDKTSIYKLILQKVMHFVSNSYRARIKRKIKPEDDIYYYQVCDYCIEHTKVFIRNKDYL